MMKGCETISREPRSSGPRTPQRLHARPQTAAEGPAEGDDIVQTSRKNAWFQALIGSVLGDGCFTPPSKRRLEAQLFVGCDDRHLEYLQWLHELVRPLGVHDLRPKKGFHQHYFYTHPSAVIGELRAIFYPEGKKIVPKRIGELLTSPLALAIWYQDDGTLDARAKSHWNARIATYCFSKDGCETLCDVLQTNFGLDVGVARCMMRGKEYWQLYVRRHSMERFVAIIGPHIHPSFAYKVIGQQQR